jgi:hypothetical protein
MTATIKKDCEDCIHSKQITETDDYRCYLMPPVYVDRWHRAVYPPIPDIHCHQFHRSYVGMNKKESVMRWTVEKFYDK